MPALVPSSWPSRITGTCLTPGCEEPASERFKRRWCEPDGERLARVRADLRKRDSKAGVVKPKPPKPELPKCRLEGCEHKAQIGRERCYRHRNIPADVTVAPAAVKRGPNGECGYGCGRPARPGRPACEPCTTARRMVPTCAREGCTNAATAGPVCGYCARSWTSTTAPPVSS